MGLPIKLDFYAKQGDSFHSGPMQHLRGSIPAPDLTGAVGKCQIRKSPTSGVISELTVVIDNPSEVRYHLEQTAAIMATLPTAGRNVTDYTEYYQDVAFTWASGYRETFTHGSLFLSPEVTK